MNKRNNITPRFGRWLMEKTGEYDRRKNIIGDFEEEFKILARERGSFSARIWYISQALRSLPQVLFNSSYRSITMFKNYFKIAFRNIVRHKVYSLLNVAGLAIGLTCFLVIALFVQNQFSFDQFNENYDNIYRMVTTNNADVNNASGIARTSAGFGPNLLKDFSDVKNFVRLSGGGSGSAVGAGNTLFTYGDKQFYEGGGYAADSTFFEVFSFTLKYGDRKTALKNRGSIVISEKLSEKYFGDENPVGKTLTINNTTSMTVTGVVNHQRKSHFQFNYLTSMTGASFTQLQLWGLSNYWTYLVLEDNADPKAFEDKLADAAKTYLSGPAALRTKIYLQPLSEVYFSSLFREIGPTGNKQNIYILSVVAFFILVIACINFMNLSTARSINRAREVGVRKVLGARKQQLIRQFIFESVLLCFIALTVSFALIKIILPVFNNYSNSELVFGLGGSPALFIESIVLTALVGIFSGLYPAFFLSSFRPVSVLKGKLSLTFSGNFIRKGLVAFQFAASIALIIGSGIMLQQQDYMQNKNLGFDKEQVLVIPIRDTSMRSSLETLKNVLRENPNVLKVAASTGLPSTGDWGAPIQTVGTEKSQRTAPRILVVDSDYFDLMNMEIVQGRPFSNEFESDRNGAFILNETAVQALELRQPVGVQARVGGGWRTGQIIGIVKDFHFRSFRQQIGPMVFFMDDANQYLSLVSVRISGKEVAETIKYIERRWKEFDTANPFTYTFLDNTFDLVHRDDQRLSSIFNYATGLAILIACLGLYGLASFTAQQRIKEIGIRKVLGARISSLINLLSIDFLKIIALSAVIAAPVTYFFMSDWLNGFVYRIDIGPGVFIVGGILTLLIGLITVSSQAIKSALTNPVKTLRND